MKVFISLGTQKFQFNRLLKEIDCLSKNDQENQFYAQIGYSTYIPQNYKYVRFLTREEFDKKIFESDILITHAGTGAIINGLKNNKKIIAFPRLAKYNEHVDDHQIEILNVFVSKNYILGSHDVSSLSKMLEEIKLKKFENFVSNSDNFVYKLIDLIEER